MLKCWSQVMKFLRPVCSSDFVFWFASISPWYYRWWIWLSLVEFSFISDCCWHLTGDRRIFPFVSSSALPPTIFCWFSPLPYLLLFLITCVRRFIIPPLSWSFFFFWFVVGEILNFSLCSFLFAASRSLYSPQFGVSSLRYKPSDIPWSVRKYNVALFF